ALPHPGEACPPAELAALLVQHYPVPAQRGTALGLQTSDPAPDHHALSRGVVRRELGELRVTDAGVHRAPHRPRGVEAADAALIDPDARARVPAGSCLGGRVWV